MLTTEHVAQPTTRPTFPREGALVVHDTQIFAREENVDKNGMHAVLRSMLARLRSRGHVMQRCPQTAKNHPSLAPDTWVGRLGDLECLVEVRGRLLEAAFFQNVANVTNQYGGRYDLGKYRRMPRTIRLQCVVEMTAVLNKLRELGYAFESPSFAEPMSMLAVRDAAEPPKRWGTLDDFNSHWDSEWDRKRGTHRFERDETGWPTAKEIGHHLDRDRVPVRNGELRYFRDRGRLVRGIVRTNMNGMWYVGDFACASSHELFLCEDPAAEPRRLVPKQLERLRGEIDKALKVNDYRRVETLARVIQRL